MEQRQPSAAVKAAIAGFVCRPGFRVVPKRPSESSGMFKWGVRVQFVGDSEAEEAKDDSAGDVELASESANDDDETTSNAENNASSANNSEAPSPAREPARKSYVGWICLAETACIRAEKIIALPRGITSKAMLHLTEVHKIFSKKTHTETSNKRRQECEFELLADSRMYRDDPGRLLLLLETRRIVFHNLPFRFANYPETRLLNRLTCKQEFQIKITPDAIRHSIVEMYATTKQEVINYLKDNRVAQVPVFSLVVDFWTSPIKQSKYLGVRVYLIDNDWQLKSVLLGTREFSPSVGARADGLRGPFEQWITKVLSDFELTPKDMFSSTTDGGADVKRMMIHTFKLKWQWCIPHLSNAATKAACGMHNDRKKSKKPEMQDLIRLMSRVVYIISSNEVMGSLWKDLCIMFGRNFRAPIPVRADDTGEESTRDDLDGSSDDSEDEDPVFTASCGLDAASNTVNKATKLLNFQSHRFMGLVRMIRSLLSKWKPLKTWFKAVQEKAQREKKTPPYEFPLKKHNKILVQLLSLLQPIEHLNRKAQAEQANQVEVLLELYLLRLNVLDPSKPLPHFLSTVDCPQMISTTQIKPVVAKTRRLLFQAFEKKFFSRYVIYDTIKNEPFILESQLFMNP